jgi:uncharacterized protein (DUF1697 family)
MTTVIALLRAVNVGGSGKVSMAELTKLLTKLGYGHVKTLLQSGNVVFTAKEKADAKLEATLEAAVAQAFGVNAAFVVRTAAEWDTIIADNPFRKAAVDDPSHLVVMAFKSALKPTDVKALEAAIVGREIVQAIGKNAYIIYPDGIGTSKLTNALIERKLGVAGTARNWNTVLKLAAAAAVLGA